MKTYKASEFRFEGKFIYCDGMYMQYSGSCNVPQEVLNSIDKSFSIIKRPGNNFTFEGNGLELFFDELYQAYYPYLLNVLWERGTKQIAEGIEEEGMPNIRLKFSLQENDLQKIIDGTYSNWDAILDEYRFDNDISQPYMDLWDIEDEFGRTIPEEFRPDYEEEDFEIDFNKRLSKELNSGIIKRLSNLAEDEKQILKSARIYNDGLAHITIIIGDNRFKVPEPNASLHLDIPIESLDLTIKLYMDVSGKAIKTKYEYDFSQETLMEIKKCIDMVEESEVKDQFIQTYNYLIGSDNPCSERPYKPLIELDYEEIRANDDKYLNTLADSSELIFQTTDMNNHKSDNGFFDWWISPTFVIYFCITRHPYEKGYKCIRMTACSHGKADYYYSIKPQDLDKGLFALWAYWGSNLDNKRKDFNIRYFVPFGLKFMFKC